MITIINKKMYQDAFFKINKTGISTGYLGIITGIICYLLLAFGIYYFIVSPEINNNTMIQVSYNVFIKGFLLGLVVYGVYNTTNKATINNYSTLVTIADTMWGSILMGSISIFTLFIIKKLK